MAQNLLTPGVIAKEGLAQLNNNLVAAKTVYRGYEPEFTDGKIGDTLTIRKPVKYAVRTGNVAKMQDAAEGTVQIKLAYQRGVDLRFPTKDLTLSIDNFANRYLKHPMIALANQVDLDVLSLSKYVWNWTGTPGNSISSFRALSRGSQRLDEMAVPTPRSGIMSPDDYYNVASTFTGVYVSDVAKTAIQKAKLPMISNVDWYASQNVLQYTTGATRIGTPVISSTVSVNGVLNTGLTTWLAAKDTNQSTILVDGFTSAALNQGDVFTIAGVYAVNPVTKQQLPYLQQFVVAANANISSNASALTISPAIITTGPYQTVSAAPAANAALTFLGTPGATYPQNLVFAENAFALCMVPMELPGGASRKSRASYEGLSIRVIEDYDIINDVNMWRLDILYGVAPIYPDLATRISG